MFQSRSRDYGFGLKAELKAMGYGSWSFNLAVEIMVLASKAAYNLAVEVEEFQSRSRDYGFGLYKNQEIKR